MNHKYFRFQTVRIITTITRHQYLISYCLETQQTLFLQPFNLTFTQNAHIALPPILSLLASPRTETLSTPLPRSPHTMKDYPLGTCYTLHITPPTGYPTITIHSSAGYIPNRLTKLTDILFLGIGGLSKKPLSYRDEYWKHTVDATKAKVVVPIHWDDFMISLDDELRAPIRLVDRVDETLEWMIGKRKGTGVVIRLMKGWETVDVGELLKG